MSLVVLYQSHKRIFQKIFILTLIRVFIITNLAIAAQDVSCLAVPKLAADNQTIKTDLFSEDKSYTKILNLIKGYKFVNVDEDTKNSIRLLKRIIYHYVILEEVKIRYSHLRDLLDGIKDSLNSRNEIMENYSEYVNDFNNRILNMENEIKSIIKFDNIEESSDFLKIIKTDSNRFIELLLKLENNMVECYTDLFRLLSVYKKATKGYIMSKDKLKIEDKFYSIFRILRYGAKDYISGLGIRLYNPYKRGYLRFANKFTNMVLDNAFNRIYSKKGLFNFVRANNPVYAMSPAEIKNSVIVNRLNIMIVIRNLSINKDVAFNFGVALNEFVGRITVLSTRRLNVRCLFDINNISRGLLIFSKNNKFIIYNTETNKYVVLSSSDFDTNRGFGANYLNSIDVVSDFRNNILKEYYDDKNVRIEVLRKAYNSGKYKKYKGAGGTAFDIDYTIFNFPDTKKSIGSSVAEHLVIINDNNFNIIAEENTINSEEPNYLFFLNAEKIELKSHYASLSDFKKTPKNIIPEKGKMKKKDKIKYGYGREMYISNFFIDVMSHYAKNYKRKEILNYYHWGFYYGKNNSVSLGTAKNKFVCYDLLEGVSVYSWVPTRKLYRLVTNIQTGKLEEEFVTELSHIGEKQQWIKGVGPDLDSDSQYVVVVENRCNMSQLIRDFKNKTFKDGMLINKGLVDCFEEENLYVPTNVKYEFIETNEWIDVFTNGKWIEKKMCKIVCHSLKDNIDSLNEIKAEKKVYTLPEVVEKIIKNDANKDEIKILRKNLAEVLIYNLPLPVKRYSDKIKEILLYDDNACGPDLFNKHPLLFNNNSWFYKEDMQIFKGETPAEMVKLWIAAAVRRLRQKNGINDEIAAKLHIMLGLDYIGDNERIQNLIDRFMPLISPVAKLKKGDIINGV